MTTTEQRTYLTASDVAAEAGVSSHGVRIWARRGVLLAAARTLKGVALFDAADVDRCIERRRAAGGRLDLSIGDEDDRVVPVYLTKEDVSVHAGATNRLVKWWLNTGRIRPVAQTRRGYWLFDRDDIERWLITWGPVRRRPYRRAASRLPVAGLDETPATPACLVPPPIPRTGRRGLAVVSGRAAGVERRPA